MSTLTERITEVIGNHECYPNCDCRCGASPDCWPDWAAHVAERIEAELQLTEEHASTVNGIPFSIRYVSKWFRGPAWSEGARE